jgi:uncharacterized protein (TIGR00296 family)
MELLSIDQGKQLVKYARHCVDSFFSGKIVEQPSDPFFSEKRGVFVTLNEIGNLRGCIGFPEPVYPLKRAILESSRAAAFRDPRFSPVTKDELDDITFEVSVLTKPELIEVEEPEEYLDKVEVGKHGLIIKHMYDSGLLLPQVFTEYDCTPKKALEMTCEKAGLDEDAWKDPEAKIYRFQAQIFEEAEPKGEIIEKKD